MRFESEFLELNNLPYTLESKFKNDPITLHFFSLHFTEKSTSQTAEEENRYRNTEKNCGKHNVRIDERN